MSQCKGSHVIGNDRFFCTLDEGHEETHEDIHGRMWSESDKPRPIVVDHDAKRLDWLWANADDQDVEWWLGGDGSANVCVSYHDGRPADRYSRATFRDCLDAAMAPKEG